MIENLEYKLTESFEGPEGDNTLSEPSQERTVLWHGTIFIFTRMKTQQENI